MTVPTKLDIDRIIALEAASEDDWKEVLEGVVVTSSRAEENFSPDAEQTRLGKVLTIALGNAMKQGQVSADEIPDVASYLLSGIKKLQTKSDEAFFLASLADHWPWFPIAAIGAQSTSPAATSREMIEQLAKQPVQLST